MIFDPDAHFHTTVRPKDINGYPIVPLDLVKIIEVPENHYSEEGFEVISEYSGKYGLVKYYLDEPYYDENPDHPGWTNEDGSLVHLISHKIDTDAKCVVEWDFFLPSKNLLRIPFNYLIASIFSEFNWRLLEVDGPSDQHFVVEGMEQYKRIKQVLDTPYEVLDEAHKAAEAILKEHYIRD